MQLFAGYNNTTVDALDNTASRQKAKTPESESYPNKKLNVAAGVMDGLVLDIFAARLCDMLSRKPQDISDLWAVDERGSIAAVVSKDDELRRTKPIIVAKPSSPLSEEFRRIRTNLSFVTSKDGDRGRLIVITSSMPSEGKTTMSLLYALEAYGRCTPCSAYPRIDRRVHCWTFPTTSCP